MRLIVAVVRDEYAAPLTENLTKQGFSATKLASTGGFLRAGNTTFLIGVADEQLETALSVIKTTCPKPTNGNVVQAEEAFKAAGVLGAAASQQVAVGGATVFVLPVQRMVKV